jgi:hypothetical protein
MLFSDFEYMHFSKIVAKSAEFAADLRRNVTHPSFVCFLSGFVEEVKKAAVR